ncbi:polyisoprenoid-binding protein [Pseudoluteimonas lycopersici]|uniref:Polyisoprenoid-binding protein n=1 Tax=Pseudoluteimonas lycopersici TaxID=1324796 RepID=A0A516V4W3_9GAMM|nr:YceI family protein [Lysobacter lycopersici]QDQ73538.1 polyisoprenoid-binding protein [Lysobacter lycopersici]
MPRPYRLAFALLAFALPLAATAETAHYELDPVHTRVLFAVSHAGFSQAMGTVSGSHGELWFDPDDWSSAKLTVEVPLDRLDMGDAKWTRAVQATNLLDTAKHPVARFLSTRIEPVDATHARVCGDMEIRGVAHDACLDVAFNQLKRHPMPPFRRTAGFSATATLKRSDFGIDAWKSVIGDEVQLRIEAEALRAGAGNDDSGSDKTDSPSTTNDTTPETHP